MKLKIKVLYIFLFLALTNLTIAQSRNGLYGFSQPGTSSIVLTGLGPAYLFGDLGGLTKKSIFTDFELSRSRIMLSLNYRYMFPNNIGFKVNAMYGQFEFTDENSRNSIREYNSNSKIGVLSTHFEYNVLGGEYAYYPSEHTLYVFTGIGVLYSDSKLGSINKPLKQEFLGSKIISYNTTYAHSYTISPVIPIGIGYEYEFTPNVAVGAEYNIHIPFTDYIDGISPSGSKSNDYLMSLSLTLTYKFGFRPSSSNRVIWN